MRIVFVVGLWLLTTTDFVIDGGVWARWKGAFGMKPDAVDDIRTILESDRAAQAKRKAVVEAMHRHKLLGHPIAVGRDGEVVWIPPEEIELPPEEDEEDSGAP